MMFVALQVVAMTLISAGASGELAGSSEAALHVGRHAQATVNLCTELRAGWRLTAGESLFSALGGFRLTMQDDGNLVLYAIDDMKLPSDIVHVLSGAPDVLKLYAAPIWSTGTHVAKAGKTKGRFCTMESDGNLVVYDQDANIVFETGTHRNPGSFLRLQTDGNLVIYTSDLKPVWSSNTAARLTAVGELKNAQQRGRPKLALAQGLPAQLTMDLRSGWRLNRGDSVYSPLGGFRLILQDDGNLVLYVADDERVPFDITPILMHTEELPQLYHNALWSTNTNRFTQKAGPGAYCVMKEDGNLVLYDDDDNVRYQTKTAGNPGAFLRCQDDGNLVIYTREKKAIWQSKTYARVVDKPGEGK